MSDRPPKPNVKRTEEVPIEIKEAEVKQNPTPGYEQICNICPFKDFYFEVKRAIVMSDELNTRTQIIQALNKKLEELNKSK